MKKSILLSCMLAMSYFAIAQFSMTYKSHGLIADEVNKMKICATADPGVSGKNVVWDFSGLTINEDFKGIVEDVVYDENFGKVLNTNVVLKEYNNQFYFKGDDNSLELYGIGSNGQLLVKYNKPFVKMKYPFTYGSSFIGSFEGEYLNANGLINGTYEVTGDGYGKLILPKNIIINNALRVKSVRSFTTKFNNYSYDTRITAYRWYVKDYRFPVLVILQEEIISPGSTSSYYKVALYEDVEKLLQPTSVATANNDISFKAFPNPFTDVLNISFKLPESGNVVMDIFNAAGDKIYSSAYSKLEEGRHSIRLTAAELNIPAGSYVVQLKYGNRTLTEKVVLQ